MIITKILIWIFRKIFHYTKRVLSLFLKNLLLFIFISILFKDSLYSISNYIPDIFGLNKKLIYLFIAVICLDGISFCKIIFEKYIKKVIYVKKMVLYYSYFVGWLRQHYRKYFKVEKSNKFSDKYLYPLYLHRVPLKTKDNIFEHKLIDEWLNKDKDVMFLIEKINKEKDESKIIDLNDKLLSALIELNRIIKEYLEAKK
jgi:hypothetical protein